MTASYLSEAASRLNQVPKRDIDIPKLIRRRHMRTGQTTPWATISSRAPSPNGLCFLVLLHDTEVDVWNVDSSDFDYEVRY